MTPPGLIYAAIVLVWAAVLLPRWTRRHSDAAAERFPEDVAPTRVLSRGQRARYARAGHGSADASLRARRQAEAQARVRRARVLFGLLAATVVVLVLAAVGLVSVYTVAVPLALLGGYTVALRRLVVRRQREVRTMSSAARRTPDIHAATSAEQQGARSEAVPSSVPMPAKEERVIDLRQAPETSSPGEHWHPRPTPLPTYVSKNQMHRRSIILSGEAFGTPDETATDWAEDRSTGSRKDDASGATRAVND